MFLNETENVTVFRGEADYNSPVPSILSLIVSLFGSIGNVLALTVLLSKALRSMTTSLYLAFLLPLDTLLLWNYTYLVALYSSTLYLDAPSWFCQFQPALLNVLELSTNWIVVAVTAERLVAIRLPLKARIICRRRNTIIVLGIISVIAVLQGIRFFWLFTSIHGNCAPDIFTTVAKELFANNQTTKVNRTIIFTSKLEYIRHVEPLIKTISVRGIPSAILLICNVLIIHGLYGFESSMASVTHSGRAVAGGKRLPGGTRPLCEASRESRRTGPNQTRRMVAMLLTVSFMFLFCNLPLVVVDLVFSQETKHLAFYKMHAFWATVIISQANHSLTFLLYFMSGRNFRQEFIKIYSRFCRRRRGRNQGRGVMHPNRMDMSITGLSRPMQTSSHSGLSDGHAPRARSRLSDNETEVTLTSSMVLRAGSPDSALYDISGHSGAGSVTPSPVAPRQYLDVAYLNRTQV